MSKRSKIDLTGGRQFRGMEISTDAGIVYISTGLSDTRTGAPVVVIEVEPNDAYGARTEPGGIWDTEVREALGGRRTDIRLTRQGA